MALMVVAFVVSLFLEWKSVKKAGSENKEAVVPAL
jgi:hypothetical protein